MKVTLYTRKGCGLCHEAEDVLRRLQEALCFEFDLIDVDEDPDALRRYSDRIPVITVDGEEVDAAPIDERRLRAALSL